MQIFNYGEKEIRTIRQNGETWWVLKDICDVLKIKNATSGANRLGNNEKDICRMESITGKHSVIVINERGLYNVILWSRKPEAKKMKDWIMREIIPNKNIEEFNNMNTELWVPQSSYLA